MEGVFKLSAFLPFKAQQYTSENICQINSETLRPSNIQL